jgi:hypothetical protein
MLWFRKSSGYAPSSSSMWLARVDTIEFACGSLPRCCGDPSTAVVIGVVCAGAVRGFAKRTTARSPHGL